MNTEAGFTAEQFMEAVEKAKETLEKAKVTPKTLVIHACMKDDTFSILGIPKEIKPEYSDENYQWYQYNGIKIMVMREKPKIEGEYSVQGSRKEGEGKKTEESRRHFWRDVKRKR